MTSRSEAPPSDLTAIRHAWRDMIDETRALETALSNFDFRAADALLEADAARKALRAAVKSQCHETPIPSLIHG